MMAGVPAPHLRAVHVHLDLGVRTACRDVSIFNDPRACSAGGHQPLDTLLPHLIRPNGAFAPALDVQLAFLCSVIGLN